jgi:hypothetical protein
LPIGFLVEAEDGAGTDRNRHLVLEVVSDPIIGDPLELRPINGIGLEVEAILDRSIHPFRESDHKPVLLAVLEDLCLVFGHHPREVDIDDLA